MFGHSVTKKMTSEMQVELNDKVIVKIVTVKCVCHVTRDAVVQDDPAGVNDHSKPKRHQCKCPYN